MVLCLSDRPSKQELYRSEQPEELTYGSFDPYLLTVVEGSIQWTTLGWPRSSIIKVTRSKDDAYGHIIETSLHAGNAGELKSEWRDDGLILIFPQGHTLSIPKQTFIGGR
ncbi:MAG: hypothetical protein ACI8W8_004358 [Rhodothermales bacterium]|jgi:hypothetical protein